jgi:hypothetical protein
MVMLSKGGKILIFTILQCHEKDIDNNRHSDREIERERDKEREIYSNRKSK